MNAKPSNQSIEGSYERLYTKYRRHLILMKHQEESRDLGLGRGVETFGIHM